MVKLTHWSIVAAVLANAVLTEEGSSAHVWVGYALAAILGLRLLWGVIGPAEARFTAFLPSVSRARAHLREIRAGGRLIRCAGSGVLMLTRNRLLWQSASGCGTGCKPYCKLFSSSFRKPRKISTLRV
ncbi:hypothetical protein [Altererythrobacter sp. KTW20L]|uniref:cytochrome b/b6 domain-containing protein n=1 Tax=Altererythrobacter sp. KTW20L TaxID=2942210 RepID=UPI0020BFF251|nr:hypothetical protein [Altererythrobacter sp. KTW20L]